MLDLEKITVQEWMTTPVLSILPETPISTAHQMMKENGVRRLPVVADNRLVGIITLGDVREASPSGASTLSIWELNYLWSQLTVSKVMTRRLLTVHPDDPITAAAQLMLDKKVSGLPVVDQQERLVGIITESDIFRMLIESQVPTKAAVKS